ncbi:MAG TPA: cupin domain-containing protein [Chloroflexaceae bacterium]|nr:cupin domain-containing protein [Chloroflexaceae bacterium]
MGERQDGGAQAGGTLRVISDVVTFLATAEQTGGAFALYSSETPPGAGVPPHRHAGVSEVCLVLAGEYTFLVGEALVRATAGDSVRIPAGVVHAFTNTGRAPGRLLVAAGPGGRFEQFCRAVGAPAGAGQGPPAAGPGEVARLIAAAADYGIEILPPAGASHS